MFGGRCQIERDPSLQNNAQNLFGQMSEILSHHAPQKEPDYDVKGLHPMISVDQAAKELLDMLKQ
jgi:hypothetical protein